MTTASSVESRITVAPGKCGGKPCIRGMRIRVCDVLELLANGAGVDEIVTDYPFLEREDILAAIAYAAQLTNRVPAGAMPGVCDAARPAQPQRG